MTWTAYVLGEAVCILLNPGAVRDGRRRAPSRNICRFSAAVDDHHGDPRPAQADEGAHGIIEFEALQPLDLAICPGNRLK